jgi:hypothetical protein
VGIWLLLLSPSLFLPPLPPPPLLSPPIYEEINEDEALSNKESVLAFDDDGGAPAGMDVVLFDNRDV